MYDYVMYAVCNFVPYYRACYYVSVITDWFDIWINILIESSLLAYEMCQVILLMLCSIVWYVYRFLNTVLMGFDRYWCVFSTVYFRFRNYRNTGAVFVSENTVPFSFPIKKYESKNGGAFRRPFPTIFISIPCSWGAAVDVRGGSLLKTTSFLCFHSCQVQSSRYVE